MTERYIFSFFAEDIPGIANSIRRKINLPYFESAQYLSIYHQDQLLLQYTLPALCNQDGICNNLETYYSCKDDCLSYSKDGVCVGVGDGECDPDCLAEFDPDCERRIGFGFLFWLVPLLIVVFVIVVLIIRKKRQKPQYGYAPSSYQYR